MQDRPLILRKLNPEAISNLTRLGTYCAYLSPLCLGLFALLMARSMWSLAFTIPLLVITWLGYLSPSRSHVTVFLWPLVMGLITPQATALIYMSQANAQAVQLQQQQVQLMNLYASLLDRQTSLHMQIMQLQTDASEAGDGSATRSAAQATQRLIAQNASNLSNLQSVISDNTWRLQQLSWTLPSSVAVEDNQQAIQSNRQWITTMQAWLQLYDKRIASNLTVLPGAERVAPHFPVYPATCAGRAACTVPLWWQSISMGWQRTMSQPLTEDWFFWFWLITSFSCLCIVFPRATRTYRTIYYKKLYYGLRSQLRSEMPEEVRAWSSDTQLIKIGVWGSFYTLRPPSGNHQQDRLMFDLGLATTVTGVCAIMHQPPVVKSVRWRTVVNRPVKPLPVKAYYDGATGTVVVEPEGLIPAKALIGPSARYPLVLYIAVEDFVGNINASASIPDLQRLHYIFGPSLLYGLAKMLRGINLMLLLLGCYVMLILCSYYFFNGIYSLNEVKYSFIGMLIFCASNMLVFFLNKITVKVWQPPATPVLWSTPTV